MKVINLLLILIGLLKTAVAVQPSCIKMKDGDPNQCEECDESRGYYLFIRSRDKTQCA